MEYETKDSGVREQFATGSQRDTQEGKPRYDLIGPEGLERLALLMARGAKKYGEHNWRKGQKASRYFASAFRHLMQWAMGDNSEDHLAAVAFNVFGIMHLEAKMPEHLDHERYNTPVAVVHTPADAKADVITTTVTYDPSPILEELKRRGYSTPSRDTLPSRPQISDYLNNRP